MWMIWDRCVGKILDTRFEVTESRLNCVSFDMEIIHNKIGTNKRNQIGRSRGDLIKEKEKTVIGWEDREINENSLSSKDKVESGVYVPIRPPKKPGGK